MGLCSRFLALSFIVLLFGFIHQSKGQEVTLREAFPNLTFNRPVDLHHAGDGSDRLFVVSQEGLVYVFPNDPGVSEMRIYLDIVDKVQSGGERGLLGLAFHPDYENNGYFFVNYNAPGPLRNVIARYEVSSDDPDSADATSEQILLTYNQPFNNHNGGQIAFGPDGYLYIASGDGGSGGDPQNNAQNRRNLLGAILRIDVDNESGDFPYGIPADNPFAGNTEGYREEIYAYGLRNPWRMSFDPETGLLWCGDVGQSGWEIIHLIENGKNYGWNIIEGSHCYPPGSTCDMSGLELPLFEYEWGEDGRSITGGYVYRGSEFPSLYGHYIYGDYMFGTIWALEYDGENEAVNRLLIRTDFNISSFGTDENGEIYFFDYASEGKAYTFDTVVNIQGGNDEVVRTYRLHQNYPNPFNAETVIRFSVPDAGQVSIDIYNLLGQNVATIVDAVYGAGEHAVTWNASAMGSGVYLYRIRAGTFTETRRMVLLR
jgi:glucose/arabinose dehydrogenase